MRMKLDYYESKKKNSNRSSLYSLTTVTQENQWERIPLLFQLCKQLRKSTQENLLVTHSSHSFTNPTH